MYILISEQNRTEQILLHVNYTVSCDITNLYSGTGLGCLINIKGNGWTLINVALNWWT